MQVLQVVYDLVYIYTELKITTIIYTELKITTIPNNRQPNAARSTETWIYLEQYLDFL